MIVTVDSALNGTSVTKQVSCSYQLNAVRGAADSVGLTLAMVNKNLAMVSKNDVAQQPFAAFKGACFHLDLMRDIELTNEATGEISADIAAREATPPRAYNRYGNGRFGFFCDVPANFRSQRAPDNGDGFGYTSPDGRAQVICFGRNNLGVAGNTAIGSTSARQEFEQQLASHRSQGDSITYQALVGDSITVSGISSNGEIYFERILWGHGSVDTMNWTYLRSLQGQLQDAVEHSANTFRPGDLDSPH
jgi:hypothetical protein